LRRLFDGLGARLFGSLARGEAGSVQRAVVRAFKPEGAELARDDQHRGEASVEGFVLGVLCCGHVILPFRFRSRSGRAVFALQIEFVVWVAKPAPALPVTFFWLPAAPAVAGISAAIFAAVVGWVV